MPKNCDCVCHKLGYIYCGPGYCPDHDAAAEIAKIEAQNRTGASREDL